MSILYVGRLDELKGIRTLLEAWRLMGAGAPLLRVCGNGPMEEWCRQQSEGLPIEMKGFVDSETVKRLLSESRALILPTLWYEGFPMTVVEAFSLGVPVICSDLGNTGSLIEEGVTGWKFPAGSVQGLVQAVKKCMTSDGGINSRVKTIYESNYTPDANYRRLAEIYTEGLNENRSAGAERR